MRCFSCFSRLRLVCLPVQCNYWHIFAEKYEFNNNLTRSIIWCKKKKILSFYHPLKYHGYFIMINLSPVEKKKSLKTDGSLSRQITRVSDVKKGRTYLLYHITPCSEISRRKSKFHLNANIWPLYNLKQHRSAKNNTSYIPLNVLTVI